MRGRGRTRTRAHVSRVSCHHRAQSTRGASRDPRSAGGRDWERSRRTNHDERTCKEETRTQIIQCCGNSKSYARRRASRRAWTSSAFSRSAAVGTPLVSSSALIAPTLIAPGSGSTWCGFGFGFGSELGLGLGLGLGPGLGLGLGVGDRGQVRGQGQGSGWPAHR